MEKKRHTVKNTVISRTDKSILFVGYTFSGHNHDYRMLKQELPPEMPWFLDVQVFVDLGYLGIRSDYQGASLHVPHKKSRKCQQEPHPQLSVEQRMLNTCLSKIRIFVENAIGGMKRYNILVHSFRNHKKHFVDDVVGICAGLWNFALSY